MDRNSRRVYAIGLGRSFNTAIADQLEPIRRELVQPAPNPVTETKRHLSIVSRWNKAKIAHACARGTFAVANQRPAQKVQILNRQEEKNNDHQHE